MDNFYKILGVEESATDLDLKAAFKTKAKQYHPDLNKDPNAESMFKKVNEAYDVLKDKTKRAEYDYTLKYGSQGPYFRRSSPFDDIHDSFGFSHHFNMDDLFRQQYTRSPPKNKDVNIVYSLTMKQAYDGGKVDIRYSIAGGISRSVDIIIPKGVDSGERIVVAGKGDDTIKGIPPGNLFIRFMILPDENFVRNGVDVATSVYVDYIEAMIGTSKRVKCLDGSEIDVKIKPMVNPGEALRVKNKGFPKTNGLYGDMYIEVVISAPNNLTEDQINILKSIR